MVPQTRAVMGTRKQMKRSGRERREVCFLVGGVGRGEVAGSGMAAREENGESVLSFMVMEFLSFLVDC